MDDMPASMGNGSYGIDGCSFENLGGSHHRVVDIGLGSNDITPVTVHDDALAASTSRHYSVILQPHPLRTHECEPRVPANASCLYTQLGNDVVTTGMPTTSLFGRSMDAYAGASTSTPGMSSTSVFGDVTAACATPSTITRRSRRNTSRGRQAQPNAATAARPDANIGKCPVVPYQVP